MTQQQAVKDLDSELTESFMAKKVHDLTNRQKQREKQRANSFAFTSQFDGDTGAPLPALSPAASRKKSEGAPPDNFDLLDGPNAKAGTYFKQRRQQGHVTTLDPSATQANSITPHEGTAHSKSATHNNKSGTLGSFGGSRRKTPLERQAELDEQVAARMVQSIAEQEADDQRRREACAIQRQIERLKMQQRVKSRIEKQLAASQRPMDRSVASMGIDVDTVLSQPKAATFASQHREALKEEANLTFVKYNASRMQYNMAHRQYCIQSLQDRQRMRMSLERDCHAYYPAKKAKQLRAIGAEDDMACRFPTVAEMHAKQTRAERQQRDADEEEQTKSSQMFEITEKDDSLWAERRSTKGQKAQRLREVPFDVDRPYVKRKDMKPAHLPVMLQQPNSAK